MSRGGEREGVDYKMCEDDEKGVKVVATASDMGESGGNNEESSESAIVGDEGTSERDKISVRTFSTRFLYCVDFMPLLSNLKLLRPRHSVCRGKQSHYMSPREKLKVCRREPMVFLSIDFPPPLSKFKKLLASPPAAIIQFIYESSVRCLLYQHMYSRKCSRQG